MCRVKHILLVALCLLAFSKFTYANDKPIPKWLTQKIAGGTLYVIDTHHVKIAAVSEYNYKGEIVYHISSAGHDMQEPIFNEQGEQICFFSGWGGDGKCLDFFEVAKKQRDIPTYVTKK